MIAVVGVGWFGCNIAAKSLNFLLFTDEGYITNTVAEINGGEFARRIA